MRLSRLWREGATTGAEVPMGVPGRMARAWLFAGGLAIALAAWLAPAGDADDAFKSTITWHGDLAQAKQLAAASGKPLYVTFRCIP